MSLHITSDSANLTNVKQKSNNGGGRKGWSQFLRVRIMSRLMGWTKKDGRQIPFRSLFLISVYCANIVVIAISISKNFEISVTKAVGLVLLFSMFPFCHRSLFKAMTHHRLHLHTDFLFWQAILPGRIIIRTFLSVRNLVNHYTAVTCLSRSILFQNQLSKPETVHQISGGGASIVCIACSNRVFNSPALLLTKSKIRSPGVLR